MKILSIYFENLNSLRGKWYIDLEDPMFLSNEIFAITGPTGAGKTTIFDAICLALYGRTPRLDRITSGSNEIMSRGKNSCSAHVTFSTREGIFTSKWTQLKNNKGKLQTPKHILEDSVSEEQLTQKNDETLSEVIRLTGMDFTRFTRAMMLEQGKFDSFLTSDKNQRAAILELITGTEIYSRISSEVFERAKQEKLILHDKEVELEAVKSSGGDMSREDILSAILERRRALAGIEAGFAKAGEARTWLRDIETAKRSIAENDENIRSQKTRRENFAGRRKILDEAERAAGIEADYTRLVSSREARAKCANDVASLQAGIAQRKERLSALTARIPELESELAAIRHGITDTPDAVVQKVQTAVNDYQSALRERDNSSGKVQEAERSAQALRKELEGLRAEEQKADAKEKKARSTYDQAYDEFMALRARTTAAVLDEEREKLKPGSPCPLCGSTEHPACTHEQTAGEDSETMFREVNRFEAKLKTLKDKAEVARDELNAVSDKRSKCSGDLSTAESKILMWKEDLNAKADKLSSCHSAVSTAIRPMGFEGLKTTDAVIAETLKWAKRVEAAEKSIQSSQTDKAALEAAISAENAQLVRRQNDLAEAEAELARQEGEFSAELTGKGFGDEAEFRSACTHIKELPALRKTAQEIDDRMNTLLALRDSLNQKLAEMSAQNLTDSTLAEAEAEFTQKQSEVISAKSNIASLEQKLADIDALKARIDELERTIAEQRSVAARWSGLNDLLGSSKGDKYRVFAQQVTLGFVVHNANKYLESMNGRYTLMLRPDSDDLTLSVIDSEQAGEIRPTTNLSGGERFIVSLALALGLSQISGSKALVDSLFLDEGFGSLDEDSLNTALEALGEIRREGRMIGIISHVTALKERIAAQINVIPKQEGTSIIEGPGCSKL